MCTALSKPSSLLRRVCRNVRWIFSLIFFWLIFVVSLAGWWLYFGVTTLSSVIAVSDVPSLQRHQRMLFMEGCVLLALLVSGGLALFYFSYRMYKEKAAKEVFFASFTHDLKTTLFRLQLEAEKLGMKHNGAEVEGILGHARKMHLDLENSLDSIAGGRKALYRESVQFQDFMRELHAQWPEIGLKHSGNCQFTADLRALHSIFKNLLHNSQYHGLADEVRVQVNQDKSTTTLHYSDNGQAFTGDLLHLGRVYHHSSGGSGFGLYIVSQWVQRMGGRLKFSQGSKGGLEVAITLPGGLS